MGRPDLSVDVAGLRLTNPIIAASGCFGYGVEYAHLVELASLGGVAVKGLFLEPRHGHPPPRIVETPAGMLNAIGLQGIGVRRFVDEKLPALRDAGATVIVNICGSTVAEYAELARILSDADGVAAIEINISCPNINEGGHTFGCSAQGVGGVVQAVRAATPLPIFPKLTPNVTDIASMARAAEDAGADAVSLVNTFLAMAIDVETRRPLLSNVVGGPERAGDPADSGAHGVRVPGGNPRADHRDGRHRKCSGRSGIPDRRGERGAGGNGELRRSGDLAEADGRSGRVPQAARVCRGDGACRNRRPDGTGNRLGQFVMAQSQHARHSGALAELPDPQSGVYFAVTAKWPRRLRDQQPSWLSVQKGDSSPRVTTCTRLA